MNAPTHKVPHPTETAAYWRQLAREQMAFAAAEKGLRRDVEHVAIYRRNAAEYTAIAERIEASEGSR